MRLNVDVTTAKNRLTGVQTYTNLFVDRMNEMGRSLETLQYNFGAADGSYLDSIYKKVRELEYNSYEHIEQFWNLLTVIENFLDNYENLSNSQTYSTYGSSDGHVNKTVVKTNDVGSNTPSPINASYQSTSDLIEKYRKRDGYYKPAGVDDIPIEQGVPSESNKERVTPRNDKEMPPVYYYDPKEELTEQQKSIDTGVNYGYYEYKEENDIPEPKGQIIPDIGNDSKYGFIEDTGEQFGPVMPEYIESIGEQSPEEQVLYTSDSQYFTK